MDFDMTTSGIPFLLFVLYMAVYSRGRTYNHNETMVRDTSNQ